MNVSKHLKAVIRAYSSDKQNDILLSAYERLSGLSREKVQDTPLFTAKEIEELDRIYKTRLEEQVNEILEDN